jgi:hypothetical protein
MDTAMRQAETDAILGLAIFGLVVLAAMLFYRRFLLRQAEERRAELAKLSQLRGMEFHPGYSGGVPLLALLGIWFRERDPLAERLSEWLGFFGWHPNPVLSPVLFQATSEMEWFVIDYATDHSSYQPDAHKKESPLSKSITVDHFSIVIARLSMTLPPAQVDPASKFYRARAAVQVPVFRTESKEFNDRFVVFTWDPALTHEVLHPLAINHLLERPNLGWEMNGPYLMAIQPGRASVEEYGELMDRVQTFIDLIPDYMKEDHGFDPGEAEAEEFEDA